MAEKKKKLINPLEGITDDIRTNKTFIIMTYGILCLIAVVMTVVNIFTNKGLLTYCTGVFGVLCGINIAITLLSDKLIELAKLLFSVEVIVMFSFFLVTGRPDGFSAIWIAMLPSIGMFFFDKKKGSILCAIMFAVLVFFLWIPYGNQFLQYDYTATFKMRFPILFVAFHLLAYMLETLRVNAYKEMRRLQDYYLSTSKHDPLTGLYNRQGLYATLSENEAFADTSELGVAMFDIDYFKQVNDTYGHSAGDEVLKQLSAMISENLDAVVCRWGGEEIVAIYSDYTVSHSKLQMLKQLIEQSSFAGELGLKITVSIGVSESNVINVEKIDELINNADIALYEAKNTGKNKVVHFEQAE